jgi:DNA-binding beta-propeller fold protein YncE
LLDPKSGRLETVGGSDKGFAGDGGPASRAKFDQLYHVALSTDHEALYICDLGNRRIRRVDLKTNVISTVAGNGKKGRPEDGAVAVDAPLVDPRAVAVDRKGNVYILERGGNALRVVGTDGKIRTVVNASGKKGGEGDGGEALAATMNGPKHLCVDKDDTVIIADAESHLVRRYIPATGKIERVAGTGKHAKGAAGGDPLACDLARPHGVTVHPVTGELYITDSYNNRVLKIVK